MASETDAQRVAETMVPSEAFGGIDIKGIDIVPNDRPFDRPATIDRMTAPRPRGHAGQRPSKSADTARARELARIRAMTPRERILLALELRDRGRRLSALLTGPKRAP